MKRSTARWFIRVAAGACVVAWLICLAGIESRAAEPTNSQAIEEKDARSENLKVVYQAIQAYQDPAFDGAVYESPGMWELASTNRVSAQRLSPAGIFADEPSALASGAESLRAREAHAAKPVPAAAAVTQPSTLNRQPAWLAAALGGILILAASVWILARRTSSSGRQTPALLTDDVEMPSSYTIVVGTRSATEPASVSAPLPSAPHPIIHIEAQGATHTQAEALRQRALAAEQRADRATALIRARLIPHLRQWLKQNLLRKLIADRSQLLETQQAAVLQALAVEERLCRLEQQLQRQIAGYQARIEELTRELIAAQAENRELIRARIAQVKAEMAAARARLMAEPDHNDSA